MKTERYSAQSIKTLLLKCRIATMKELKNGLNTDIPMTVLRKLKELTYITSYSHSGKYYTLKTIAKFDKDGLWSHNNVYFSTHDTLLNTIDNFVNQSTGGYSRKELEEILHVKAQEQLHQLFKIKKIRREKIEKNYIYFSPDSNIYRKQRLLRQEQMESMVRLNGEEEIILVHELRAAIILFYSVLDEQQRRLYAGLESLKLGRGGDKKISELLGIDTHTVAKGRNSLLSQDIAVESIRKKGGGRDTIEKKHRK